MATGWAAGHGKRRRGARRGGGPPPPPILLPPPVEPGVGVGRDLAQLPAEAAGAQARRLGLRRRRGVPGHQGAHGRLGRFERFHHFFMTQYLSQDKMALFQLKCGNKLLPNLLH